jgi:hypothetical protein
MKRLVPIPSQLAAQVKDDKETGIGYRVISVQLKNGSTFDQVVLSEGHIVEVRGHSEIPFAAEDVAAVRVNHKWWNFRGWSDARLKMKAAAATAG